MMGIAFLISRRLYSEHISNQLFHPNFARSHFVQQLHIFYNELKYETGILVSQKG